MKKGSRRNERMPELQKGSRNKTLRHKDMQLSVKIWRILNWRCTRKSSNRQSKFPANISGYTVHGYYNHTQKQIPTIIIVILIQEV